MTKPILAAILSCAETKLTDKEKYLFSKYNPLGITLFSRNLESIEQTQKLINEIRDVVNREDILIGIDQEGGRVSRLKELGCQEYVSAEDLGSTDSEFTKYHANLISKDLRNLGVNVNYAPVIDVKEKCQTQALYKRCFSSDRNEIIKYGKIMADTYLENGICPCIKHIPGHFMTPNDPHLSLPITNKSKSEIEDYISYIKEFKKYPLAMTSHVLMSQIDKTYPASESLTIISEIIRGYLQYEGFLISDAVEMHALKGSISERVNKIIDAGVDSVLACSGIYSELEEVCLQERILTEKSLIRFAKIKKVFHNTPRHIDIENIKRQYQTKFKDIFYEKYSYDATEILEIMHKKGEN